MNINKVRVLLVAMLLYLEKYKKRLGTGSDIDL